MSRGGCEMVRCVGSLAGCPEEQAPPSAGIAPVGARSQRTSPMSLGYVELRCISRHGPARSARRYDAALLRCHVQSRNTTRSVCRAGAGAPEKGEKKKGRGDDCEANTSCRGLFTICMASPAFDGANASQTLALSDGRMPDSTDRDLDRPPTARRLYGMKADVVAADTNFRTTGRCLIQMTCAVPPA